MASSPSHTFEWVRAGSGAPFSSGLVGPESPRPSQTHLARPVPGVTRSRGSPSAPWVCRGAGASLPLDAAAPWRPLPPPGARRAGQTGGRSGGARRPITSPLGLQCLSGDSVGV